MAPSIYHIIPSSLLILSLTSGASTTAVSTNARVTYQLSEDFSGPSFFNHFNFFTLPDYTNGFVTYVNQATAKNLGLISAPDQGPVYIGVENVTVLNPTGPGRSSVRITSKQSFNHGLFILDLAHMPGSICGAWPAYWMVGQDWPNDGEIDIIEGVNVQQTNLMSLHTNENCSITATSQTGDLYTPNCDVGFSTAGCGVGATSPHSYGSSFNSIGGGVYATSWTSEHINIWFFPRNAIPADITSGNPNPSGWGLPQANMAGDCDIDAHFGYMQLIFDTTFCGDWAGSVWTTDKVCRRLAPTCNSYVAKNPGVFSEAYWSINYLKVFNPVPGAIAIADPPKPTPTSKRLIPSKQASLSVKRAPSSISSSVKRASASPSPPAKGAPSLSLPAKGAPSFSPPKQSLHTSVIPTPKSTSVLKSSALALLRPTVIAAANHGVVAGLHGIMHRHHARHGEHTDR